MNLNLTLAGLTPSVGMLMGTTCSIPRVSVGAFTRRALPLFAISLLSLFLVTDVAAMTLCLPELVDGD